MTVSRPIHLLLRLLLPFVAASIIGVCLFSVLRWSADRADAVAMARQQELVETIVSNMQSSIAHDQEGVTVWDDAVRGVLRNDKTWMAANLGRWMYTYFQHDGAFVVNPDRQMIYGFASDAQDEDTAFRHVRDAALPLVDKLQERLKASDTTGVSDRILSIGESDLNIVNGRPAIVSVKPIVSDTGDIAQVPGRQFVHVAVRYLDSSFRSILGKKYGLEDIRFTWSNIAGIGRAYSVLTTGSGATFGYLTWKPFRPGATVVAETLPAIAVTSGVIFVLGALLGQMVWKRSLRLEASQARLQQLANYDVLTGLANRATFNRRLDQALSTSSQGEPNAVLFLDLDRFKQVNDTLGHPVGDRLIIQVSRRLRDVLPDAVIARIGGDEFTIILEAAG
jgi:sensor domain CHASE-containing protein